MSLVDDAKANLEKAKNAAGDIAKDVSDKADVVKQNVEGHIDKAQGHEVKGEAKIKASELRDKL